MTPDHKPQALEGEVRHCMDADRGRVLLTIQAGSEAYRDKIPADCWREPYMSAEELDAEVAHGVMFSGYVLNGTLVGVMGVQRRFNVDLIRHAYVLPTFQGCGIGSALIARLRSLTERPILVGTWRAAEWAIGFYERHDFARVPSEDVGPLLKTYWAVSERQIETSLVLSAPALEPGDAAQLIEGAADS